MTPLSGQVLIPVRSGRPTYATYLSLDFAIIDYPPGKGLSPCDDYAVLSSRLSSDNARFCASSAFPLAAAISAASRTHALCQLRSCREDLFRARSVARTISEPSAFLMSIAGGVVRRSSKLIPVSTLVSSFLRL